MKINEAAAAAEDRDRWKHRRTIMEASEAAASGSAAPRGPWRWKQGVDFNDVIDIFAKSKALKTVF